MFHSCPLPWGRQWGGAREPGWRLAGAVLRLSPLGALLIQLLVPFQPLTKNSTRNGSGKLHRSIWLPCVSRNQHRRQPPPRVTHRWRAAKPPSRRSRCPPGRDNPYLVKPGRENGSFLTPFSSSCFRTHSHPNPLGLHSKLQNSEISRGVHTQSRLRAYWSGRCFLAEWARMARTDGVPTP